LDSLTSDWHANRGQVKPIAGPSIVSVVNPARIKGFAQGELLRNKTDQADAALLGNSPTSTVIAPGFAARQHLV